MGLLDGKVAIITGGGRGLGRAYALRFAAEGARVVVNDIGTSPEGEGSDPAVAAGVVNEIVAKGGRAVASTHDVTDRAMVDALANLAIETFGAIDILVCSAGILHVGKTVLDVDDASWDKVLRTNLRGTLLPVQVVAQHMVKAKKGGRILTTTSITGLSGNAGLIDYATSKAAIYGLSRCAALELAAHEITVNILSPMAWTRLTSAIPVIAAIPNGESVLSADYVADVALFLVSDLAADITGHVVDVGGPQLRFHALTSNPGGMPESGHWTPQELLARWSDLSK